jgi:hypothetical protein
MKRIPSIPATRPPPHAQARFRAEVVLVDVAEAVTLERRHALLDDRRVPDVQAPSATTAAAAAASIPAAGRVSRRPRTVSSSDTTSAVRAIIQAMLEPDDPRRLRRDRDRDRDREADRP